MTDKERLERIIQMQYDGYTIWDMSEDDLVWLIEQAERVYELESDSYNAHLERLLDRREQQIKRYQEALEAIACFDDKEEGEAATRIDARYIARKALEGEE